MEALRCAQKLVAHSLPGARVAFNSTAKLTILEVPKLHMQTQSRQERGGLEEREQEEASVCKRARKALQILTLSRALPPSRRALLLSKQIKASPASTVTMLAQMARYTRGKIARCVWT